MSSVAGLMDPMQDRNREEQLSIIFRVVHANISASGGA